MGNRLRTAVVLLALVVGLVQQGQAGQPAKATLPEDLAELVPASTLLYMELNHRPTIDELRVLFKGSAFKDYAAFRGDVWEKMGRDNYQGYGLYKDSVIAALLAPELLDELHRFRAHAVAVTAFPKGKGPRSDGPRMVWILDGRDSNIPSLITRQILILAPSFQTVTTVNGVRLYQTKTVFYEDLAEEKKEPKSRKEESKDNGAGTNGKNATAREQRQPREPAPRFGGPVIALLPKVVVVGSDVDMVRDVVLRIQGKKDEPSLASTPAFQKHAALRKKPGVFAYADLEKLVGPKGQFRDLDRSDQFLGSFFGVERLFLDGITLFNPESLKRGTAHLGVEKGTLELQLHLEVDTTKGGPSDGLLFSRAVNPEAFQYAPANSLFVLSLPVTGDGARWERLRKQLDAHAPAWSFLRQFSGPNVQNFEKAMKLNLGKDLVNRLAGITLAFPPESFQGKTMPLLILEGKNEAGAKLLANIVPRLLKVLNPKAEVVTRRQGDFVIVGANDKAETAALEAAQASKGFGSRPAVAGVLNKAKSAKTLGIWSLQGLLAADLAYDQTLMEQALQVKDQNDSSSLHGFTLVNRKDLQQFADWLKTARQQANKITSTLPGGEFSVQTVPEGFTLRIRQTGLSGVAPQLTDLLLERELRRAWAEVRSSTSK